MIASEEIGPIQRTIRQCHGILFSRPTASLLATVVLLMLFAIPNTVSGFDWPHFLGPNYDSTSPEKGIRIDWSDGKLPLLWSYRLGTGYGIGSVARGRYLQLERVGSAERLICLDARTGKELWQQEQPVRYEDMYGYNNGPRSSPTIDGDLVYTLGVAGRLTAWSIMDGAIQWTVDTNRTYGVVQNFFGVGSSPIVIGDLVVVMVGGSPAQDQQLPMGMLDRASPNGSAIVAFDKATGKERYRVGNYLASYSTPRPIEIEGETYLITLVREGLLGIDPRSGTEKFMFPWRAGILESVNAAVPVIKGREILISECYGVGSALLEVDPSFSKVTVLRKDPENRRRQSLRAHWATPIRIGDVLFGCSGRNPGDTDLRCIDWRTGEPLWIENRRERTSFLALDGHLIVLGEYGGMELIRANSSQYERVTAVDLGVPDASQPTRPAVQGPFWAAPIVANGLLYVRGESHLLCFELISDSGAGDSGEFKR